MTNWAQSNWAKIGHIFPRRELIMSKIQDLKPQGGQGNRAVRNPSYILSFFIAKNILTADKLCIYIFNPN